MDAAIAIYLHGYVQIYILHIWINRTMYVCIYTNTRVYVCTYTLYMYFSEVCVHIYIEVSMYVNRY